MRRLFGALTVLAILATLWSGVNAPAFGQVGPSPVPSCGTPLYTPVPGTGVNASPMAAEIQHVETCSAIYWALYGSTAVPTPTPGAAPTSANSNCSFAGAVLTCTTPTPAPNGAYPGASYLTTLKAEASLQHCWFCGTTDVAGCGTAHDSVGDGGFATAVPSPVSLPTITASSSPSPVIDPTPNCAAPGVVKDGNHAVAIFSRAGGGQCVDFDWPLSTEPTTGSWTIEVVLSPTTQVPWDSGQSWIWNMGTAAFNAMYITQWLMHDQWAGGTSSNDIMGLTLPYLLVDQEWDGTNHMDFINGTMVYKDTTAPSTPVADGEIGGSSSNGHVRCYNGRMQYFARYNTALPQSSLYAHWAATGW